MLGTQLLDKPGGRDRAISQLLGAQGKTARFYSALAVYDPRSGKVQSDFTLTKLRFRTMQRAEIEAYVEFDKPFDCAGAFKVESAGIGLFSAVISTDPSAIVGLPLIKLTQYLRAIHA